MIFDDVMLRRTGGNVYWERLCHKGEEQESLSVGSVPDPYDRFVSVDPDPDGSGFVRRSGSSGGGGDILLRNNRCY